MLAHEIKSKQNFRMKSMSSLIEWFPEVQVMQMPESSNEIVQRRVSGKSLDKEDRERGKWSPWICC